MFSFSFFHFEHSFSVMSNEPAFHSALRAGPVLHYNENQPATGMHTWSGNIGNIYTNNVTLSNGNNGLKYVIYSNSAQRNNALFLQAVLYYHLL